MCLYLRKPNWHSIIDSHLCRKVNETEPRPQFHFGVSWYASNRHRPARQNSYNLSKEYPSKVDVANNYCNSIR